MLDWKGYVKERRLREVLRYTSDKVKTQGPFWIGYSGDATRLYMVRRDGHFSVHFAVGLDKGSHVDYRARVASDPCIAIGTPDGNGYAAIAERIEHHGFSIENDYDSECFVCGLCDCEC